MIFTSTGRVTDNIYLLGHPGYPLFLYDAPQPVIFDACVRFAGNIYIQEIQKVLGSRQPSFLFLTHAHWDHCGAVSCLQDRFPSMRVGASGLAIETLKRPNAVALMTKLNNDARIQMQSVPEFDSSLFLNDPFQPFEVDLELKDNAMIDLGGGLNVQVLATPGHTRDHHSFYLPQERILIAGEAAGLLLVSGDVTTEFLSGYDMYLSSLQRLAMLPVDVFCQGHGLVLVGRNEIQDFFKKSISETIKFKNRVFQLLDEEHGGIEAVMQRIKAERYDPVPWPKQPEVPYMINLKAQVSHLAAIKVSA